jgi:choice-of-anchor A domain-containing protein
MTRKALPVLVLCASISCAICYADPAPFGAASAFNLVALGNGSTPGNIGTNSDVGGRIAAAGEVTQATTIGSSLGSDPWGSLADGFAMVAAGGVTTSNYFNINGGGNAYSSNGGKYNFNDGGHLVTTGGSPINFSALATTLDAESLQLSLLSQTGTIGHTNTSNPQWLVLTGTSTTLNVFTLTEAEFSNAGNINNIIDIEVPAGSTVIINVDSGTVDLGAQLYYKGSSDTDADAADVLFDFEDATSVYIGSQLDGSILAPYAVLTGGSQMGGTFIAAEIGETGEVHNDEFTGTLPPTSETPEPESLVLMGSGILALAGALHRRKRRSKSK